MAFGSEIRASQISFLPKYGLKMEIMFQIKFGKLINPDLTDPYINGVLYMHMGLPLRHLDHKIQVKSSTHQSHWKQSAKLKSSPKDVTLFHFDMSQAFIWAVNHIYDFV